MPTITESISTPTEKVGSGRYLVRIIDAGEGSSGTYSPDVLQEAGRAKVWPAGTHMYLDHPTATEDRDRPVRTVKDLAGVLAEDARWDPETQSLVAEAKIYSGYRTMLDEMADDIGLSIRATAEQARDGSITRIVEGLSVDFVTRAGRGGKVLQILESARLSEASTSDRREQLEQVRPGKAYVVDFDEATGWVVFRQWHDDDSDTLIRFGFTVADDDKSATLTGDGEIVRQVTTFVPINDPAPQVPPAIPAGSIRPEESTMPQIEEARLAELTEAASRVSALESERDTAIKERDDAVAALTESRKAEAAAKIDAADLPDAAKARVRESLDRDAEVDVEAAIKAESDYIAALTPAAQPLGFGESKPVDESTNPRTSARNPWGRTITQEA